MVQTQSPATEGYTEFAKLLGWGVSAEGGHEATALKSIRCCKANSVAALGLVGCTAANVATDEATATHGFTVANGTVSRAGAVTSITHEFTAANGGDSIVGFACENDDDDCVFGSCLFNAALDLTTNGDKLTCTMDITVKIGAA